MKVKIIEPFALDNNFLKKVVVRKNVHYSWWTSTESECGTWPEKRAQEIIKVLKIRYPSKHVEIRRA